MDLTKRLEEVTNIASKFSLGPLSKLTFSRAFLTKENTIKIEYLVPGAPCSTSYRKNKEAKPLARLQILLDDECTWELADVPNQILKVLRKFWVHEFEEFCTYGDAMVYEPHPDGTNKLQDGKIVIAELNPKG